MHNLSDNHLGQLSRLLRPRDWEDRGNFYDRVFHVRIWKSRLPSAGTVFGDGFSLNRVRSLDCFYLNRWVLETYRAEITHWATLFLVVLFFLWNPPIGWLINLIYALIANLPCIIVQRYNRPRVLDILRTRLSNYD